MKKKRTTKEIDRQIIGLEEMKKQMPRKNFFGEDNHAIIEAQIAVLKGHKKPDDYYQDESSEDFQDGDNELWSQAERAERWLNGDETDDLFE